MLEESEPIPAPRQRILHLHTATKRGSMNYLHSLSSFIHTGIYHGALLAVYLQLEIIIEEILLFFVFPAGERRWSAGWEGVCVQGRDGGDFSRVVG